MQKSVVVDKVGHSPTLNTVLMVEETLEKAGEPLTLAELKRELPRKVMHSTLTQVLDYLQESGKIIITTKGIVWVFAPRAEIEAMKKRGIEL
jgi:hypothetical protein